MTTLEPPQVKPENSHPLIDPEELRVAMRGWPSGVTIVAAGDGKEMHGMTVSSFTSVSLQPPQVLVCAERITRTAHLIEATGAFSVTVLPEGSGPRADRFGGRDTEHINRFEGLDTFNAVTGSPILSDYLSYFDCVVTGAYPGGTHTIFVGKVVAAGRAEGRQPLVYWHQGYYRLNSGR